MPLSISTLYNQGNRPLCSHQFRKFWAFIVKVALFPPHTLAGARIHKNTRSPPVTSPLSKSDPRSASPLLPTVLVLRNYWIRLGFHSENACGISLQKFQTAVWGNWWSCLRPRALFCLSKLVWEVLIKCGIIGCGMGFWGVDYHSKVS